MTTSTDGAPPSVAPEPDGGSGPAGDSSLRRSRERPPRDETDEGVDTGPGWLREEIQRRIAEGRSRSGGRHARRDSVSPGSIGYVPRHSVATPGPGAPRPGPVGGSPSPHASELLRRERTEANRAGPAPAAWSGPLGAPAETPVPETDGAAPAADPIVDQGPEASAAAPPASSQPGAPPVSPPSPSPRPRPAPAPPVDPAPAPAVQAPPDGSATGPGAVTPQQAAAAATAPDVEPTTTDATPDATPDAAVPGPPAAAPPAAETAPAPTRPRPARPSPGPAWLGEPPSTAQAPVAPVPPAPEPPATEEPAAAAASAEPSAVQATAPTAPVVPGRPVLGDPVFTARTPQPGTRGWDVVDPVRVPEQRAADDPNDLQSRRVRVVLAERRGVARPVRTVVDIQEGTGVGEFLRNDLIKTQLSIALRFATGAALTLGLLPLLFAMIPEIGHIELLGIRLPWLVLGLLVYPFLFGIGLWYSRLAEKVEHNFADHVQD